MRADKNAVNVVNYLEVVNVLLEWMGGQQHYEQREQHVQMTLSQHFTWIPIGFHNVEKVYSQLLAIKRGVNRTAPNGLHSVFEVCLPQFYLETRRMSVAVMVNFPITPRICKMSCGKLASKVSTTNLKCEHLALNCHGGAPG